MSTSITKLPFTSAAAAAAAITHTAAKPAQSIVKQQSNPKPLAQNQLLHQQHHQIKSPHTQNIHYSIQQQHQLQQRSPFKTPVKAEQPQNLMRQFSPANTNNNSPNVNKTNILKANPLNNSKNAQNNTASMPAINFKQQSPQRLISPQTTSNQQWPNNHVQRQISIQNILGGKYFKFELFHFNLKSLTKFSFEEYFQNAANAESKASKSNINK